jgi:hypothetical protein
MTYVPDVDPDRDIYIYDDDESYLINRRGGKATPIVNLDTFRIYGSLKMANQATKISKRRIKWCCLDDIDALPYGGRMVKFAYGEYDEGKIRRRS